MVITPTIERLRPFRRRAPSLLLPFHIAIVGGLVVLPLCVVLVTGAYEPQNNHDAVALGTGLAVLALVMYTRYGLRFPWLSASLVYLLLLWVFHFGLAFTAVIDPGVLSAAQYWEVAWLYMPNARLAMTLAALGAAGFVLGAAFFAPSSGIETATEPIEESAPVLHYAGLALLVLGIAASTFTLIRALGTGLFSVRYVDLMAGVMQETRLSMFMDASEMGCLLAICGAEPARAMKPLFAWAPFGLLLLLMGMRNEAMVPLAAFGIVLAHRGVHFRRSVLITGFAVLLITIPVIRSVRTVGFENRDEVALAEVSPLEALTEFGGTLHAAAVYIDWIADGDPLQWGAGYLAPIDRQVLVRLMPWRTAPPLESDPRIPSRNIEFAGAIGLSATGEAYYNFGVFGPFLFYGLVGMLLSWLERQAFATPYRAAMLGIAMLVLFFNIRSYWLAVPGRAGMALAILAACHLIGRRRREPANPVQTPAAV